MKDKKKHIEPPKWADRLLSWYCSDYYFEEVQGDLHEWFYYRLEEQGPVKAKLMYPIDVIRYFRSFRLKTTQRINKNSNYLFMKNSIKITFRTLGRDGLSAILRIGNLSMGIIVFLLTFIYAQYELNYDTFHHDYERIYRVAQASRDNPWAATPMGMGPAIVDIAPEIETMTRVYPVRDTWMKVDESIFTEKEGYFVDSTFFKVFTVKAIDGNLSESLVKRTSVVLTESMARKYFGDQNPIGKTLELGDEKGKKRTVSAIIADPSEQSHFRYDFLLPLSTFSERFSRAWRNWATYTYVKLFPDADLEGFTTKVTNEYEQRYDAVGEGRIRASVTPITDIHLKTNHEKELADNGNIGYVYILLSVGVFVLLISCINFVNLSVIKGLDRGKEVGLRKTIGASKGQVIGQFLVENFVVILLASVLAMVGLTLLTPYFRNFSELNLPLNVLQNPEILAIMVIMILVLEMICGVYPALVLSRFKPAQILKMGSKGGMRGNRLGFLRKGLIILQFAISIILIISSLLIYNQLNFLLRKDIGFEKEQVITVRLDGEIQNRFSVFRDALLPSPAVKSIATSSHIPGYRIMVEAVTEIGTDPSDDGVTHRLLLADEHFVDTYGLEMIEGRNFNEDLNGKTEYIVNEAAVEYLFQDREPLTRELVWASDTGKVVGIVKNFNFQSLHNDIEPLVISSNTRWSYASIRFDPKSTSSVIDRIEKISRDLFPNQPSIIEYEFLSDRFASLYRAENKLKSLVWIFCVISIILTVSGIFGMATYIARQKTREIAIRKVLGSSISQLFNLMSKDFVILLVVSLLLAIPAAYYLSSRWLQDFAYQVPIGLEVFVVASVVTLLLVLMSSGFVTNRAVKANPTEALKSE